MDIELWTDLLPSAAQAREMRDVTGAGLVDCKKQLLRDNIETALIEIDPETRAERVLVACLRAALHEGMI